MGYFLLIFFSFCPDFAKGFWGSKLTLPLGFYCRSCYLLDSLRFVFLGLVLDIRRYLEIMITVVSELINYWLPGVGGATAGLRVLLCARK